MSQANLILEQTRTELHLISPVSTGDDERGQIHVHSHQEFYEHHAPRLLAVARRILKDNELAKDAVQEAFKNIFLHLPEFRGESRLETWMTRIVVNVCLGYLRKHKIRLKGEVDCQGENEAVRMLADQRENPLDSTYRSELRVILKKAMGYLKRIHQEVIFLHDIQQKTLEEISEILDTPVGTIKSRLFYGRKQLRDILESSHTRQAYHLA